MRRGRHRSVAWTRYDPSQIANVARCPEVAAPCFDHTRCPRWVNRQTGQRQSNSRSNIPRWSGHRHRRLRITTFESTNLVTISVPASYPKSKAKRILLTLEPNAPENRKYLDHSEALGRLARAIEELEPSQTEVTLPTLKEPKDDVAQTILKHDQLAVDASNTAYEKQEAYREEGMGATIIKPG